jgi:hypothetical protein
MIAPLVVDRETPDASNDYLAPQQSATAQPAGPLWIWQSIKTPSRNLARINAI